MIGESLAHYSITEKLGEGGMGVVYRAEDTKLRRPVALKILAHGASTDPQARQRLLHEARLASRLNHPNIATIYEVVDGGEIPFIAMELVLGESLKEVIARGPLPVEQVLGIALQIAEALWAAHQVGVLHRDIKPANVMLDGKRRVKILDFGLGAFTPQRSGGESMDEFLSRSVPRWTTGGTVPYMPPEQLRGNDTDARGDIFSFGVLLYECVSGRLPFAGATTVDILYAILRQKPAPVSTTASGVSSYWDQFFDRCLAKEPSQRFDDMRQVLDMLRALEDQPAAEQEKSLAVLYFENLSSSREDEYFRDGMTEDVITELSQIKELRVFPRSAMLAFRDRSVTAQQVGRELAALYVLEGSLRRSGDRLRITARLVETATGHSVWSERYDRQLEDVFAIQDEIAQNIARAMRVVLSEQEKRAIEKVPTADVQAYDFYLRGRKFFHQFRRKGYDYARQMFARAIAIDPTYARAYAGVADCCSLLYTYWDASAENLKEADKASLKALELDPDLAEAHVARGLALMISKKLGEAEREFETAIRLNPELFEAYYFYARACRAQGKLDEALRLNQEACRVSPEDYQAPNHLASIYAGLGLKEESERASRRALAVMERHLDLHPDDARALYLGANSLCRLGEHERGLEWAGRALVMEPAEPTVLYNVACVYSLLGRHEAAMDCLEKAVANGFAHREWIENDSDLAPLRQDDRFRALLSSM